MRSRHPFQLLLTPVCDCRDRPEVPLSDRIPPGLDRFKVQERLLNGRCQQQQIHDLADPRPRHHAQTGEFGHVADLAGPDQVVEPDGEGHQPGHPRDPAGGRRLRGGADPDCLAAAPAGLEVDTNGHGRGRDGHAASSPAYSAVQAEMPPGLKVTVTVPSVPS